MLPVIQKVTGTIFTFKLTNNSGKIEISKRYYDFLIPQFHYLCPNFFVRSACHLPNTSSLPGG